LDLTLVLNPPVLLFQRGYFLHRQALFS
jgi:hypothetical protein